MTDNDGKGVDPPAPPERIAGRTLAWRLVVVPGVLLVGLAVLSYPEALACTSESQPAHVVARNAYYCDHMTFWWALPAVVWFVGAILSLGNRGRYRVVKVATCGAVLLPLVVDLFR